MEPHIEGFGFAPGTQLTLIIRFAPVAVGDLSGELRARLSFSDQPGDSIRVRETALLQGTGVDPLCATPTIVGTSRNDRLVGTDGDDVIDGLGGNDTINGFG
ncbi:MAG: hypothetical protein HY335_05500, partial [Deinococcus sp.]|nr:hypothetical protein [Deinococcus sp.]